MRVTFSEADIVFELPPDADRMSESEFFEFCIANTELNVERDKHGTIEIVAPVTYHGGRIELHAAGQLYLWSQQTGLGYAFSSSVGFTLPNGAVRSPDASWVQKSRHDALPIGEKEKFAHICPDFVVEIRSASDSLLRLKTKMTEYMENGCRLAFLIDPSKQIAWIYEVNKEVVEISGFEQKLSVGELMPGFSLDLSVFVGD